MRAIELFAGIGGFSAACGIGSATQHIEIVSAVDINRDSQTVYQANFHSPYWIRELETLPLEWLAAQRADLWWMSPPCTPFTSKGKRRDLSDPRCRAFLHLIDAVCRIQPMIVFVENVVGFETSATFHTMKEKWERVGYFLTTITLCSSSLGWPNRRPRVYAIACRSQSLSVPTPVFQKLPLSDFLESGISYESSPEFWLPANMAIRYEKALDRIEPNEEASISACFASAYGVSWTRSGSMLCTPYGYRRFTPREVARLLGFQDNFILPSSLSNQRLWHLLGNSLSVPSVQHILKSLEGRLFDIHG